MNEISIEIVLKVYSRTPRSEIITLVKNYLYSHELKPNTVITDFNQVQNLAVFDDVSHLIIGDVDYHDGFYLNFHQLLINWYVYTLDFGGPRAELEYGDDNEELNLSTQWVLPSADLFNVWENLYYDCDIKNNLVNYAKTMMEFSDKGVDCNVVSCNRVILLHGPPGTGKTTLCRALAQKLTIQMQMRYNQGVLIEINSHSLFSKWFSESGKLVSKMFTKIREIVENDYLFVCILIDEVESLAHAREQCLSGNEPSDSVRVVNAVLTQIDQIKRYKNVLILATSNMTEAIDVAFVDRADVKQFLGPPSLQAIYKIYYSCIQELHKTNIISGTDVTRISNIFPVIKCENGNISQLNKKLVKICEISNGLSGRTLRKIPFLAHAIFLKKKTNNFEEFLNAVELAVEHEKQQRTYFKRKQY